MISVSLKAGRLVEIRMTAPVGMEDYAALQRDVGVITGKTSARLVVCADFSAASLFPEALADRLARFFRPDNQRLERVALVVGDGATFYLQVERLLREGGVQSAPGSRPDPASRDMPTSSRAPRNGEQQPDSWGARPITAALGVTPKRMPTRRAFRSAAEAISWLDEILTPEERARLRAFFEPPK
jgi:hypothetical protein